MNVSKGLLLLIFCALFGYSHAQSKYTISGYIKDARSGEELIGATVYVQELGTGATSNAYGFYSLTLPEGNYTLLYSYVGFINQKKALTLTSGQTINIELSEESVQMQEVVVSAQKMDENVTEVKMSRENIKIERIKSMPALFGEVDVLRSLQMLPGIQSAGEGTTGLFVRGGSADQTLMLLDEATVYNASHFLGFFSVFNPDAIKDIELYKGGIPAEFGGRLASIVDVRMKDGNSKNFAASGGIGTISSRLTLEGPLVKDKASYIISGRRTYADLFLKLSPDEAINSNTLYFYDLNAKMNYKINDKNRIFLSGYFGKDVFGFDDVFGLNWGNTTTTLRWNHLFSPKLFLNTTVLFSDFNYGFDINDGAQNFQWKSNLQEYALKLDFNYFLNPSNELKFGSNTMVHRFSPATIKPKNSNSIFESFALDNKYAVEQAFYLSNNQKISDRLSLQYGLRYSLFQNVGPGRVFQYAPGVPKADNTIVDTVSYGRLEKINLYHGLEPRLGARFLVDQNSSVKASYNRMRQYLQIASNSTAGLPIDRWVPADSYIKPQIGDQVAVGYFRNFKDNMFEASVEVYYKWMQNQIDFKDGAEILLNNNLEAELLSGKAWAYGSEFMLKKNTGRTTGWISYTLAKAQRQIEGINNGNPYSPRYDRRHNVSLVLTHELSPRLSLSGNWVYTTGSAVTYPQGFYEVEGQRIAYYPQERNTSRMPAYHRMDLSLNLAGKKKPGRKWESSWNFSLYNAYARKNAFTIQFRDVINGDPGVSEFDDDLVINTREPKAVKTSLFGIVPSVTYNFKFQ
ncbi:TonB-dependent receptor [Rhodocytophaga aerolata]|uniref:TonB-dependent receptor n=1 Tax=Rhodocytophaga aerolata TaxID=455078 RepID=A0ABT8QYF5_9BACT|nr:TonB-dependent receptor [Rhodocytophaga aerolata]MDO1444873.1 TonB-dependent receptor [Rhodocytophaga aerolata]